MMDLSCFFESLEEDGAVAGSTTGENSMEGGGGKGGYIPPHSLSR